MSEDHDLFAALGALAHQRVTIAPGLDHVEIYTWDGLLSLFWHDAPGATGAVIACGGALGGVLGPADGLYHDLGTQLAARGIATIRVGYRQPNQLGPCTEDLVSAAALARGRGIERFVTVGHSFGGAIAARAGAALGDLTAGVVTLATQSAGCEDAEALAGRPVLLLHGDHDEILPFFASQMVQMIIGGELVLLPGAGHLLSEAAGEIRDRLLDWIPARLAAG